VLRHLRWAVGGGDRRHTPTIPDAVRDVARRALSGPELTRDMLRAAVEAEMASVPAEQSVPMTTRVSQAPTPDGPTEPSPSESVEPAEAPSHEEVTEGVATGLLGAVAEARHPLAAELALCPSLAALRLSPDLDERDHTPALVTLLGDVTAYAEDLGSPDALALLRVISVLGPDVTRAQAQASAQRLATAGVPDRPWARRIGNPDLLRAWHYGDQLGEQGSVGLLFDYRGREHAFMVLIDHRLGGGVKDCWVAEGRQAKKLHDDIRRQVLSRSDTFFEDIDAARAAELLETALAQPTCAAQKDQVEDVAMHLELLRSRVRRLRESASGGR